MRLVIDERLPDGRGGAARVLKRIERDVGGELAGYLALVDVGPLPLDGALVAAAERVGLSEAPDTDISREEARAVIASLVDCDLAYRARRNHEATGVSVASAFLGIFEGDGARFFTNGDLGIEHAAGRSGAWSPLTSATFDTGVVVVDGSCVAVFWVEDED
jgi:hypothetical protein